MPKVKKIAELRKAILEVLDLAGAGHPVHRKQLFEDVKSRVPQFCDDSIPCPYGGKGYPHRHPKWQHEVEFQLTGLKVAGLIKKAGQGYWESIKGAGTPVPVERPPDLPPVEPWSDVSIHERMKLKLKEIGEILGKHCVLEFREPPYVYDVVWSNFQGLPPSHVFEVQDKGQVNGALGKLQHALHNFPCEGRLFVVVTGERDRRKIEALLHPFFAGAYHELSKHTIMLTPEEVSDIHEWVVAHQGVLKRLLGQ